MIRPYLVVGIVTNNRSHSTVVNSSISYGAESSEAALGIFVEDGMKNYPPSLGWVHHPAKIGEFSKETLQAMVGFARPEEEIPESIRISTRIHLTK